MTKLPPQPAEEEIRNEHQIRDLLEKVLALYKPKNSELTCLTSANP